MKPGVQVTASKEFAPSLKLTGLFIRHAPDVCNPRFTVQKFVLCRSSATMGAMAEVKKPNNTIDKLALIVTTYKRQQLLETLFDSILALEQAPWRIVIVDNEQSDQTADMVAAFAGKVTGQWGTTVADQSGNEERVVYAPQTENLGGAGGFSAGVAKAYELGAAWFWGDG